MVSDEGTKGKRGPMGSFARNHPVAFVLASTMAWLVLLLVLMGIASSALRTPYDDPITGTVGRLAVTACVLLLVWHLGWMKAAGVTRLGRRQVWLLALGGMVYFAVASLYSLYGQVSFDFSSLIRLPESRTALTTQLVVAMGEEVLFRGLLLYALYSAWGSTRKGTIGSVVVTSLLFAALHLTQVFTHGVSLPSALLLTLETCAVAVWWGALVVVGGSIWPAVMLHFTFNTIAAVQGLAAPTVEPGVLVYTRLLLFSLPLGALGTLMLVRAGPDRVLPEHP
jgi:membrane protease YdiL (CAAX protease family)